MNADKRRSEIDRLTRQVIGCAFRVGNALGCGFLEKVYENSLAHEIRKAGLKVVQQHGMTVHYDEVLVGEFAADLLVEDSVLVELKAVSSFEDVHAAQCINYLRASGLRVCLLINFGRPRIQVKRFVRKL